MRYLPSRVRKSYCAAYKNFWQVFDGSTKEYLPSARIESGTDEATGKVFKKNAWEAIAAVCGENNISPEALIASAFSKAKAKPPDPWDLVKPSAIQACAKTVRLTPELASIALNSEMSTFQAALTYVQPLHADQDSAIRAVLSSTTVGLSPLFIYCLCEKMGYSDMVDLFYLSALQQYGQNPEAYKRGWPRHLPKRLIDGE